MDKLDPCPVCGCPPSVSGRFTNALHFFCPKIDWLFGFSCRTFLCTLYSKVGLVCGSSMFFKPVHSFQKSDQRVDHLS